MRTSTKIGLVFSAILALTACGEGSSFDESFKASFREKTIAACAVQAKDRVPAGLDVDVTKVCGCVTDKIMEGKSATQLASAMPGAAEGMAMTKACLTELYPNAMK